MIIPLRQCANGGARIAADGLLLGCCDSCEILVASVIEACERRGYYYLRKTGYLYHLTDTSKPLVASTLHWITWTIENDVYVWRLNSIDCDCQRQVVAEVRGVSVTSIADFGYGFFASEDACDGLCEDEIAILVAQAVSNGWTILGAGVLCRRTSAQYSCYRFDFDKIPVSLCIDTGTSIKYVGCTCYIGEIESSNYGLWGYLEYDACRCLDIRELMLAYPAEFGVDDVSFGDDTVYTYDKSQSTGFVETYSCLERSTSYDTWFCDYRNMYVIFDNSCIGRPSDSGYSYTPDYFLMKFDTNGRWLGGDSYPLKYEDVTNGTLYFDGKIQPFTTSEHNKEVWPHSNLMNWKGLTIRWIARNSNNYMGGDAYASYHSQSDAQTELERLNNLPNKYGSNSFEASCNSQTYFYEPKASVTPPNFSGTPVEGRIEYNNDTDMWDVYAPHMEFGADGHGVVYNLNFTMTNKGFLVNGGGSFSDTLAVYGFTDTIPSWTYPPTEQQLITQYEVSMARCHSVEGLPTPCPEGTVKKISFGDSIMEIPLYDMSYKVTSDESMGGCQSKEWWDAIIGQYEDEPENVSEDEP